MEHYDVKRLALVLSIQAEIEGMKVRNLVDACYSDHHFEDKAEELRNAACRPDHQL